MALRGLLLDGALILQIACQIALRKGRRVLFMGLFAVSLVGLLADLVLPMR